jgi:peptide/nickel transport system ATP-binding protein
VLHKPAHPYTLGLLRSIPHANRQATALSAMAGELPDLRIAHEGCIFRARCWMAQPICATHEPAFSPVAADHGSRCHFQNQVVAQEGVVVPGRNRGLSGEPLLTLTGISKAFGRAALIPLPWTRPQLQAVDDVSFTLRTGETLAIVGESGSGKSTLARCIVGLLPPSSGQVFFGRDVLENSVKRRPRELVRQIQIVFQNPDTALNPQHTAGEIVRRPLLLYRLASRRQSVALARALMTAVKLGKRYFRRYPPQLSGGEKQRVNIARAFAANPAVIVCDEVTSSLDISVQAAILNELRSLQDERQTSYIFISHDLGVVRYISDRVMVMFGGKVVEMGNTTDVYSPPYHPYTEVLLSAVADDESDGMERAAVLRMPLGGTDRPAGGCIFHRRCPRKIGPICEREAPPIQHLSSGHVLACHIPADELTNQQTDAFRVPPAPAG